MYVLGFLWKLPSKFLILKLSSEMFLEATFVNLEASARLEISKGLIKVASGVLLESCPRFSKF